MKGQALPRYRKLGLVFITWALVVAPLAVAPVWAYDLPLGLNLGATSFLDGGPPAGPGFYFTEYIQYIGSDEFTDNHSRDLLPGSGEDLSTWVFLSQFIYQSNQKLPLGGKWGLDVIVPVVSIDLDYSGTPGPFLDNGTGFGDVLVGPFVQWDPVMGRNGPIFMHRIEFQMMFPTGKYDDQRELNPGSNYFSFNHYWAGTLFLTPKLTVSWRLHYLLNAENDDPDRLLVAKYGARDSQAGQAIHLNFATAYEVLRRRLRLGINGYYLVQITDTQVNGDDVSGRRERVLGIGPGALLHLSPNSHLFFNVYFETQAKNRPESQRLNLRLVHHF